MNHKERRNNPLGQAALRVLELAARAEGVTSCELIDLSHKDALRRLKGKGQLQMVKRYKASRYFTTKEAANAWARNNPHTALVKPVVHWPLNLQGTPKQVRPFEPAYVGEPKRTQGLNWTHDPRFQLAPGEKPPALFSGLGIGRYLE